MSKHSSDSNSRDRNRNYGRYYNQRRRSSSSSSTESSRHSRRRHSSRSQSRYHKKSKFRHRSSSSDYSSRHKHTSRANPKDESRSKKPNRRRNSSSSSSSNGYSKNSSSNHRQSKSSRTFKDSENTRPNSSSNRHTDASEVKSKDPSTSSFQLNIYDPLKMENSIEEINQEGFVFKVFKPTSEQKNSESTDCSNLNGQKLNDEIINSLPVEKSTFVISSRDRLLSARHKLLTKQERCVQWAKYLFLSYKQSERND